MDPEKHERFSDLAQKRVGTVLRGKYHLDAVIGVGGMAVVYRATHRNRAEYAVKMLLPEHSTNESIRRRFLREGYAANSVKHPGAVRVVDDDETDDGVAFLVLELLDGMACDRLASAFGGRLPLDACCAIGLQVLDVLEAAHARGIVHRDIKPANLFVLRDGAVKALDFGIARVRESMTSAVHTTGGGMFLGTPAFMAPEQALGGAGEVDARVDIWAVGASLFALASGATVHEGDSGQRVLVRLLTQSARSLAVVVPDAPRVIVEVIDRALLFDRDLRWESAGEMREALAQASRVAFEDPPSPASLASLVASAGAASPALANSVVRGQKPAVSPRERMHDGPQEPTLPEAVAKAVIETSRPVSRDGSPARSPAPRVRFGVIAALAVFGLSLAITVVFVAPRTSATHPGAGSARDEVVPIASATETGRLANPPAASDAPRPPASPVPAVSESQPRVEAASSSLSSKGLPPIKGPEPPRPRSSATSAAAAPDARSAQPAAAEDAASIPNCKPPFYYDAQWNRVFKKECLHN